MKQTLSRNIALTFRVDANERDHIVKRMDMAGISTLRTFLLKMALTGSIRVSRCSYKNYDTLEIGNGGKVW